MSEEREYHGKEDEKTQEKENEKGAEKSRADLGEKYRNDPFEGIVMACILIWAGLAWILSNTGVFGRGTGPWPLIFAGAGVVIVLGVIVRLLVPEYRRPIRGKLVLGFVLIGIGLGQLFGWSIIGPVILIAIALSIIIGVVTRQK